MGNHKSRLLQNKIVNNITNTEGTQGLMTINSEKNLKKNVEEVIYKEKIRNNNMYSKRESVDILLNKNNINSIPTENNEIIKNNNINIRNNAINYNNSNKNMIEIKITQLNQMKKNIKLNYPKNISKEEINEIINISLKDCIIDDKSEYILGQNLTKEQVDSLVNIIYENITMNKNNNKDYIILDEIKVKIWMKELNKENIEKMFFQGKKISQFQNDIIMKNLKKERKKVKTLFIEFL